MEQNKKGQKDERKKSKRQKLDKSNNRKKARNAWELLHCAALVSHSEPQLSWRAHSNSESVS